MPYQGERLPGELFKQGVSLLVISKGDEVGRMFNVDETNKLDAEMLKYWKVSSMVLNMSQLYERVIDHLLKYEEA